MLSLVLAGAGLALSALAVREIGKARRLRAELERQHAELVEQLGASAAVGRELLAAWTEFRAIVAELRRAVDPAAAPPPDPTATVH